MSQATRLKIMFAILGLSLILGGFVIKWKMEQRARWANATIQVTPHGADDYFEKLAAKVSTGKPGVVRFVDHSLLVELDSGGWLRVKLEAALDLPHARALAKSLPALNLKMAGVATDTYVNCPGKGAVAEISGAANSYLPALKTYLVCGQTPAQCVVTGDSKLNTGSLVGEIYSVMWAKDRCGRPPQPPPPAFKIVKAYLGTA